MGKLLGTNLTNLAGKCDPGGFSQPWNAQLFAITLALCESGKFSWGEWAEKLGKKLASNVGGSGSTGEEGYYESWMDTIESLLDERGFVNATEIDEFAALWREAYLATPHGVPVRLVENDTNQSD